MDSEHRHELEENALAAWMAEKIETIKPQLPAIGLGLVALVAGLIGWSGWKASAASAKADRWRDFSNAIEGASPKLDMLKKAATDNPGTAVEEWAEVTWADAKLYEASVQYFRNRPAANEAVDEAIAAYERLISADDRAVFERANFQLGRAYELQGKLDEATKQYARVTGPFAEVAKSRAEDLGSGKVKASYEWITATKTASASATIDPSLGLADDIELDDLPVPEIDADQTLDDLLGQVEAGSEEDAPEGETAEDAEDESATNE